MTLLNRKHNPLSIRSQSVHVLLKTAEALPETVEDYGPRKEIGDPESRCP